MKITRILTILAGLAGSGTALAACDMPDVSFTIPSGDEATLDEMVAAQTSVREYIAAMDDYLACLDTEKEAMLESASDEEKASIEQSYDQMHNTGVGNMEETAAEFNEQRAAYNASVAENADEDSN